MDSTEIVNGYLSAFYAGDFEAASSYLSEDFHFRGPFVEAHDRASFLSSAAPLSRIVEGHSLWRQWMDGDEIASIYEVRLRTPAATGTLPMFEWHRVAHGRLIASRLLLDTAAFRALMPAARS